MVVGTRAGDRQVAANTIQKIIFDEDTGQTRTIKSRVVNGQIEQALEDLSKLNLAEITRPELRADLEYYRAYCLAKLALQGAGDKNAAGSALYKFISTHKRNYHLFEASKLMGDVSQAVGRFDTAATYYGYLSAAPWPDMQLQGGVLTASALMSQEKYKEAAAKYDEVLAKQASDPASMRQKQFAQVGKAYCVGLGGDTTTGIQLVEKIIADNNPQDGELFGRAYNAMGVCHQKAGNKKEAMRAFLHTHLLFNSDANTHAEALYHLSGLFEDLDQSARALSTKSLLKGRYGTTVWASK